VTQAVAEQATVSAAQGYTNCLALAAVPTSVVLARRYVGYVLRQWSLSAITDTAELIASELATNAIKISGLVVQPRYADRSGLTTIVLCVYRYDEKVVVEVWDRDRRPPVRRQPTRDDESGRGLLLVEELSHRWGYRWPSDGGKVVWAELLATT
jgi:anti-sigma regulatory factor (Ser/Thr protein kinase)